MSLGENIRNAFDVVDQTNENVNKLIEYCKDTARKDTASKKDGFELVYLKPLRWTRSYILLFQDSNDNKLDNNWRDGPVYVLEINLCTDVANSVEPTVKVAKFDYADLKSWGPWAQGLSPSDHWVYFQPLYAQSLSIQFEPIEQKDYLYSAKVAEDTGRRYFGLRRITYIDIPLTDITYENAYKKIFDGFRSLRDEA
jgi:hypothetical protein